MGIDDQHPAILRVLALEGKLHSERDREGTRMLSLADCTDARQAVEAPDTRCQPSSVRHCGIASGGSGSGLYSRCGERC
jgi:hypothetical protein